MELTKLQYLVKVMEMIEDNPEKLDEKYIQGVHPPILYDYFSQFCLDKQYPYVLTQPTGFKLSQEGVRKLDELRNRLNISEYQEKQTSINKLIALTGFTLLLMVAIKAVKEKEFILPIHWSLNLILAIGILFLFLGLVWEVWKVIDFIPTIKKIRRTKLI